MESVCVRDESRDVVYRSIWKLSECTYEGSGVPDYTPAGAWNLAQVAIEFAESIEFEAEHIGRLQTTVQRICSALKSPSNARGTLQVGVAGTGDVGPIAGTAGVGFALDAHGNVALYGFGGAGGGAGLSGELGLSVQGSNAYEQTGR